MTTAPTDTRTADVRLLTALLAVACGACALDLAWRSGEAPAPLAFDVHRVDVNQASVDELRCLPGVGPVLAGRIVAARELGLFHGPLDLRRVHGIGPALVRRVAPYAAFAAPREPPSEPPSEPP